MTSGYAPIALEVERGINSLFYILVLKKNILRKVVNFSRGKCGVNVNLLWTYKMYYCKGEP